LKEELKKGQLRTGKKKELQNRLRAFIALEIEHGEDEEEGGEKIKKMKTKSSIISKYAL
jgi:hypothetical protein